MWGEFLTRWTIRGALLAYAAFLFGQIFSRFGENRRRWIWTVGCLLFVAHVLAAFHFYHGWSHAHALDDTARQTRELLGWEFGEGIYFSYLFAIVWLGDVVWSWFSEEGYRNRPRAVRWAIHGYLFFIVANGAAIFEGGVTRFGTVLVLAGILFGWVGSRVYRRRHL